MFILEEVHKEEYKPGMDKILKEYKNTRPLERDIIRSIGDEDCNIVNTMPFRLNVENALINNRHGSLLVQVLATKEGRRILYLEIYVIVWKTSCKNNCADFSM